MALSLRRARVRKSVSSGRPQEVVVLSGGGSLGAAQVGSLRALYEAGIRPDAFVGCSVGALNAAFLAVDPTQERLAELEGIWRTLDRADVFGRNRRMLASHPLVHAVRRDDHLYEPDSLRSLVKRWVPIDDLGDTAVPCHVVTTDLVTGQPSWWADGDPVTVLTASACLPALFPPVALGGSLHVDGGVVCPVPIDRALELGAARVWVVDTSGGTLGRRDDRMTALDVLLQSFAISRAHLDRPLTGVRPDQRVVRMRRPDLGHIEMRDFSQTPRLMAAGYAVAKEALALANVPGQRTG
ncbi:MAG: Patatin [Bryobacterales bacterium]|nr:Patatin [Bryobacterales bacterium]